MSFTDTLSRWQRLLQKHRLKRSNPLPLPPMPPEYAKVRSGLTVQTLLEHAEFQTVLDVGTGFGVYADLLDAAGKTTTRIDLGKSRDYNPETQNSQTTIVDFLSYTPETPFDCVWASHVLEHSPDPQAFLKQVRAVCKEGGWIAITVPPAKGEFVGGHLSLWTPGLLLYHLALAGVDCSNARVLRYGYNISVIVQNQAHSCDLSELAWDLNDIKRLAPALPPGISPRDNGDMIGDVYETAQINFIR